MLAFSQWFISVNPPFAATCPFYTSHEAEIYTRWTDYTEIISAEYLHWVIMKKSDVFLYQTSPDVTEGKEKCVQKTWSKDKQCWNKRENGSVSAVIYHNTRGWEARLLWQRCHGFIGKRGSGSFFHVSQRRHIQDKHSEVSFTYQCRSQSLDKYEHESNLFFFLFFCQSSCCGDKKPYIRTCTHTHMQAHKHID